MKKIFLMFFLLTCAGSLLCAGALAGPAASFQTTISIDKASLSKDFYKKAHRFYVNTAVKDISRHPQKIIAWVQYGWNWTSTTPVVVPCKEALQNFPVPRMLEPGQEYRQKMEMCVNKPVSRPVTFRLGFSPVPRKPIPATMDIKKSKGITWSNSVTLPK